MPLDWTVYTFLIFGLSSALVAGVFQSFSDFVMSGLARAAPAGGIDSMQQLNRTVFRSAFITTFLGLVPVSIGFAAFAWWRLDGLAQGFVIAAAMVYVPSVFGVTVAGNVPMNERLDKLTASSAAAAEYWPVYVKLWTRWNTVRTFGSIATALFYLLAAVLVA